MGWGVLGSGVWKECGKRSLCGSHVCAFKAQHLSEPGTPMLRQSWMGGRERGPARPAAIIIANVVVKRKEGNELCLSPS